MQSRLRSLLASRWAVAAIASLVVVPATLFAGTVTGLVSFSNGTTADATVMNANFGAVKTAVDGNANDITALRQQLCELKGGIWNAGSCTEYVRLSTGTATYANADNLCAGESTTHRELCSWVEVVKFLHPNHPDLPTVSATRFMDGWVGNYGGASIGTFASTAWGGGDVGACSNLLYRARVKAGVGGDWERSGFGCATAVSNRAWCCYSNGDFRD